MRTFLLCCVIGFFPDVVFAGDAFTKPPTAPVPTGRKFLSEPLISHIYTADPAAHVFNDRLYIYPSHDIEGVTDRTDGNHYAMRDYHVFSLNHIGGKVTDHGVALDIEDVP